MGEYRVYSDVETWISPAPKLINTIKVNDVEGNFHFEKRKRQGTWVNSNMFIQTWKMIKDEGAWAKWDWTVKVDIDAIIIPMRLRSYLEKMEVTDNGIYLENCKYVNYGFFGSLTGIRHGVRICSNSAAWTCTVSTKLAPTTSTLMRLAQHGGQRARRKTGSGSPIAPLCRHPASTTSRNPRPTSSALRPPKATCELWIGDKCA